MGESRERCPEGNGASERLRQWPILHDISREMEHVEVGTIFTTASIIRFKSVITGVGTGLSWTRRSVLTVTAWGRDHRLTTDPDDINFRTEHRQSLDRHRSNAEHEIHHRRPVNYWHNSVHDTFTA